MLDVSSRRQRLLDQLDCLRHGDHADLPVAERAVRVDERPGRVDAHPVGVPGIAVAILGHGVANAQLRDRVAQRPKRGLLADADDDQPLRAVVRVPLV